MAAMGLLISWATMETNMDLATSSFLRAVMSRSTATAPRASPLGSKTGLAFTM